MNGSVRFTFVNSWCCVFSVGMCSQFWDDVYCTVRCTLHSDKQRWISNTKWSCRFSIREFGKIITVSKAGYLPTGTPDPDLKEGAIPVCGFWVISPLAVNIENSNKNRNNTEKCEGERSEAELFFEKWHKIERFFVTLEHKLRWKSQGNRKGEGERSEP